MGRMLLALRNAFRLDARCWDGCCPARSAPIAALCAAIGALRSPLYTKSSHSRFPGRLTLTGPGRDTESPGRDRCLVPGNLQKPRNVSFFIRNQYYPKRLGATAPKLNLFSGCSRPWTFKSQYLRSPDAPRHPQDATRRPKTPPRRPKTRLRHLQVTILVDFGS